MVWQSMLWYGMHGMGVPEQRSLAVAIALPGASFYSSQYPTGHQYHHHHPQYLQRISLLVATIITITVNCPPHFSHKQDIILTFSMTVMFVNTASE